MTKEEKEKLVKLLNLTTSDSDGEALNAIRAANRILKKYDLTFGDVIALPNAQEPAPYEPTPWNPSVNQYGPGFDFVEFIRKQQEANRQRAQAEFEERERRRRREREWGFY